MTTTQKRRDSALTVLTHSTGLVSPPLRAISAASGPPIDIVDQWGMQSFPASDPPANW